MVEGRLVPVVAKRGVRSAFEGPGDAFDDAVLAVLREVVEQRVAARVTGVEGGAEFQQALERAHARPAAGGEQQGRESLVVAQVDLGAVRPHQSQRSSGVLLAPVGEAVNRSAAVAVAQIRVRAGGEQQLRRAQAIQIEVIEERLSEGKRAVLRARIRVGAGCEQRLQLRELVLIAADQAADQG